MQWYFHHTPTFRVGFFFWHAHFDWSWAHTRSGWWWNWKGGFILFGFLVWWMRVGYIYMSADHVQLEPPRKKKWWKKKLLAVPAVTFIFRVFNHPAGISSLFLTGPIRIRFSWRYIFNHYWFEYSGLSIRLTIRNLHKSHEYWRPRKLNAKCSSSP